jgi:mono/diheme cytochrome c family protein
MSAKGIKKAIRMAGLAGGAAVCMAATGASYLVLRKPAIAAPLNLKVEMTPARIARGKYIFTLSDCSGCHSGRDFSRFDGPVIQSQLGQGVEFPKEMGLPGHIASRNITTDIETGIGGWTDGEKIRAIREGISRDGTMLFPMMPYERFRNMSDEDVMSLVAYLNTLPPVKHKVERSQVEFPVSVLVKSAPQPAGSVAPPDRADRAKYGGYLVNMAGCSGCHTQSDKGKPKAGWDFAGGERFTFPGAVVVSANISPDPQTGIGRWSEQDFIEKFQCYREYAENGSPQVGPENFTIMPWLEFSQLETNDLRAIYSFLRRQKPVYHAVDSHPGMPKTQLVTKK